MASLVLTLFVPQPAVDSTEITRAGQLLEVGKRAEALELLEKARDDFAGPTDIDRYLATIRPDA